MRRPAAIDVQHRRFDLGRLPQRGRHPERTIDPARRLAAEAVELERRISDLVNAAYGLMPEEIAFMWRTAPPRTPLKPVANEPIAPRPGARANWLLGLLKSIRAAELLSVGFRSGIRRAGRSEGGMGIRRYCGG